MRKLAVCYPGDTPMVFMASFESIVNLERPDGFEVKWFRGTGWCQARRRIHAAEKALEWGAELICTMDVDQVYEPDTLGRLVARIDEGYPLVAAMVPMRGYVHSSGMLPFQRLAWRLDGRQFVPVDASEGDMQPCEFPTSACMIFRAEDLRKIDQPWYWFTYDQRTWKQIHGEDAQFVVRLQHDAKIRGWVDTTIRVKHCHVFQIDETYSDRFADWSTPGIGESAICSYPELDQMSTQINGER